MTITEKIKASITNATGLTCYYQSAEDLNRVLDDAQFPCALFFLLKGEQVQNSGAHYKERINAAVFFVDMSDGVDFSAERNEQIIDGCKKTAYKWLHSLNRSTILKCTALNGSERVYAEYDSQLTGYAVNVQLEELRGEVVCFDKGSGVEPTPPQPQPDEKYLPLRFTSVDDYGCTIAFEDLQNNGTKLEYNRGDGWHDWDFSPIALSKGQSVEIRGDNSEIRGFIGHFVEGGLGRYKCSGDVMSLLYKELTDENISTMRFAWFGNSSNSVGLFADCKHLISPPETPATYLTAGCYAYMFFGCANLQYIPDLPALKIANTAYERMFCNCAALIRAEIYAETLGTRSFVYLFSNYYALQEIRLHLHGTISSGQIGYILTGEGRGGILYVPKDCKLPEQNRVTIPTNWRIVYE